ncbi:TPA: hypothetical protein LAQ42_001760 [Escherichia coli]|nr:hypothetical protein [Escherichia coli]
MSNIDKQALREIAAAAVGAHERLSVMPPDDISISHWQKELSLMQISLP